MAVLQWVAGTLLVTALFVVHPLEAAYGFGDSDYETNFIEYYSAHKMLTKCYGNGSMDDWQVFVDIIYSECTGSQQQQRLQDVSLVESMAGLQRAGKAYFDEDRLGYLARELTSHISCLRCIFQKLDLSVCDSGVVIGKSLKEYVSRKLLKQPSLKAELIREIEFCEQESLCGEFTLLGYSYVNFFKLVKFYKCWQDSRLLACIKYDINSSSNDYELAGLKDFISDVDDTNKRLMITSAYYNDDNKLGALWEFF